MVLVFKLWDLSRKLKIFIAVDDNHSNLYEYVILKGSEKMCINGSKLVLESDGTIIDDDDVLKALVGETIMLLESSENWRVQGSNSDTETLSVNSISSHSELSTSEMIKNNKSEEYENMWLSFKIPWDKMSLSVLEDCKNGQRNVRAINTVIHIVVDAIRDMREEVSNKTVRLIAYKIVSKYPKMFQDIDDDGTVMGDDGAITVYSKIKERLKYLNRSHKRAVENVDNNNASIPFKLRRKRLSAQAGCSHWQPPIIDNLSDDSDSLREKLKSTNVFNEEVKEFLNNTYPNQRDFLNSIIPPSVTDIKDKWPILLTENGILWHFKKLMDIDIRVLTENMFIKAQKIISVGLKKKYISKMPTTDEQIIISIIKIICSYFGEDYKYICMEINSESELEKISWITPVVICRKDENQTLYCTGMENECLQWTTSLRSALQQMFALYFNFNLEYCKEVSNSLEIFQRYFLKIYPEKGTKNRKASSSKLKLVRFFNVFQ